MHRTVVSADWAQWILDVVMYCDQRKTDPQVVIYHEQFEKQQY